VKEPGTNVSTARPAGRFADYVAIARPDHWVKHVFILPGIALNITVLSYDGVLFFGITSCRDALPGMEESASFIYDAFDALYEAAV